MKAIIVGNYGADNLGDELILEGILKTIRRIKPATEIVVLSANPRKTHGKFEVKSVNKFPSGIRSFFGYAIKGEIRKTFKEVKSCDFFIVGGGGLFDDTNLKALWIWSLQTAMAYLLKKKVIMYGQSIKNIKSKFARKIIGKLFKKATFVAVRDEDSKENLKIMTGGKTIHLMPDLIFNLEPKFKQAKENKILICLRDHKGKPRDFDKNLTIFLNNLLQNDKEMRLEFVPFEKGTDEKYAESLMSKISERQRISLLSFSEERRAVENAFTSSKLVIGERLHGILMAINTGAPFIAINYNPKVRNILETLGLGDFVLETSEASPKQLSDLFGKIIKEQEKIKNLLENLREEQMRKHLLAEEKLLRIFSEERN